MVRRWAGLALGLLVVGGPAHAGVVFDPIPPVLPGLTLSLTRVTTLPDTSPSGYQKALVQSLQPLADGSGRLFANDTRGLIYITDAAGAAPAPWFDIRSQGVGFATTNPTQTGLMSFAFSPNFGKDPAKPGYNSFYTIDTAAPTKRGWTGSAGGPADHDDVVREWTVADPHAATAQITGRREVMRVTQPFSDHGPGTIAFNPTAKPGSADYGKLYIGLGDGGNANDPLDNAQNLQSPFGKILRIDPRDPDGAGPATYGIPADNPFAGQDGKRGEVWASGLRNPQSFSWDPRTGQMLIGDIGQAQIDEVDVGRAGANYGWPAREGTFARGTSKDDENIYDAPPDDGRFADPIAQYSHGEIGRDGHQLAAISGILAYDGAGIPALDGLDVVSDLVTGRLFTFDPNDTSSVGGTAVLQEIGLTLDGQPTTLLALAGTSDDAGGRVDVRMGVDGSGEIYLLSKTNGDIFRLEAGVPEPAGWALLLTGFGLAGAASRCGRRHPVAA